MAAPFPGAAAVFFEEIHMQHQPFPPLVRLVSFGFLHSPPPPEAHVVVDLRTHFRDPHVSPEMRQLTIAAPPRAMSRP